MIQMTRFSPSQAAKISGVNVSLQRDWRRRNILPPLASAQAEYSPFEVARLMALGSISSQSLSPLEFKGVSGKIAAAIVARALGCREAYTGAFDSYYPMDADYLVECDRAATSLVSTLGRHTSPDELEETIVGWRCSKLAEMVTKQAGYDVARCGAFVRFADGSEDFYRSVIQPFEQVDASDARMLGPLVVMDLYALGREFLKRSGPLGDIDADDVSRWNTMPGIQRTIRTVEALRQKARGE
jgi:hypothetical protein